MPQTVCRIPGCIALAQDESGVCAIHQNIRRREFGDAPIHCYACGAPIRIGRRWVVRAEGAFHLRPRCSHAAPESYTIRIAAAADEPQASA